VVISNSSQVRYANVPFCEGYSISSSGNVYSLWAPGRGGVIRESWFMLKPSVQKNGYCIVRLKGKNYRIDYLVLVTFLGPRPNGYRVCHLDGNPGNNHLENLQWMTGSEIQRLRFERDMLRRKREEENRLHDLMSKARDELWYDCEPFDDLVKKYRFDPDKFMEFVKFG